MEKEKKVAAVPSQAPLVDGGRGTALALAAEKINDMSRGGYIVPRAVRASAV